MKVVKVGITPKSLENLDTGSSRSSTITRILREAVRESMDMQPVPEALIERVAVSMPDDLAAIINAKAVSSGVSLALYTAGLIAAKMNGGNPATESARSTEKKSAVVGFEDKLREPLRPLYRGVSRNLAAGKVVFAQAYTGSGKGRMIAALAIDAAKAGEQVVVAAPLAVSYQILANIRELTADIVPTILLGRPNFIDPVLLENDLGREMPSGLYNWIIGGGKPLTDTARALNDAIDTPLAWLMIDAKYLAGDDINLSDYVLTDTSDSPAQTVYTSLRQAESPIIICSHTLLAVDHRLLMMNKSLNRMMLPRHIDRLIIDEAHLFEQALAGIYVQRVHLDALMRHIKQISGSKSGKKLAVDALRAFTNKVVDLHENQDGIFYHGYFTDVDDLAKKLNTALAGLLSRHKDAGCPHARLIRKAIGALTEAGTKYAAMQVELSPVEKRPAFSVGKSNLDGITRSLWERMGSVALVSATLYIKTKEGVSAKYSRLVLNVPDERAAYLPIVERDHAPVEVHILPTEHFPPKSGEDPEIWIREIAETAMTQYLSGKGGMLVLATSFATANALSEMLVELLPAEAIITQSPDLNAGMCVEKFKELHRKGYRPLWIGVGSAWTGVDLAQKDVAAEHDFLLTDLFIPRLPWRINRSMTHQRRARQKAVSAELIEAIRTFTQGVGRLVRRDGVTHRRIVVSDPRINEGRSVGFVMALPGGN